MPIYIKSDEQLVEILNRAGIPVEKSTMFVPYKPKPVRSEYTNLGYANGWRKTPDIVNNCNHEKSYEDVGRCLSKTTCHICKWFYKVDSGD